MIFLDPGVWIVIATTLLVIGATVLLHYELLLACVRLLPPGHGARPRQVMLVIFVILIAHVIAIWMFGLGYYYLAGVEQIGGVAGVTERAPLSEYVYFSGIVYGTVGFGDLAPVGPVRLMAVMESVTGLVMIAWSASFTFIHMQRDWPWESGREPE